MNEVKKYEKMEELKLQEKYRLITQRVLNPNANSFVGSRKICIPSVGPRFTKWSSSSHKIQNHKRNVISLSKLWKRENGLQASQKRGALLFEKEERKQ